MTRQLSRAILDDQDEKGILVFCTFETSRASLCPTFLGSIKIDISPSHSPMYAKHNTTILSCHVMPNTMHLFCHVMSCHVMCNIMSVITFEQGEVYIRGRRRHGLISDDDMSGLRIGLVCFPTLKVSIFFSGNFYF